MKDNNKRNILYFECVSVKTLYQKMNLWQKENNKRFLSMSINKYQEKYCCIALTNPSEVVIVSGKRKREARVDNGHLWIDADLKYSKSFKGNLKKIVKESFRLFEMFSAKKGNQ